MSKIIQLSFDLTDELGIKSITFLLNDTDLPCTSETIKDIAIAMLKSISMNKDSLVVNDLLNELNIQLPAKKLG